MTYYIANDICDRMIELFSCTYIIQGREAKILQSCTRDVVLIWPPPSVFSCTYIIQGREAKILQSRTKDAVLIGPPPSN